MPIFQLDIFGSIAPVVIPSATIPSETFPYAFPAIALGAGRCECGETLVVLIRQPVWDGRGTTEPVWGCLSCNNWCDGGAHLTNADEHCICYLCDACSECCECPYCEGCSETVRDTEACGYCRDCCECYVCRRCPTGRDHVTSEDWFCSDCECCESHCECVRCCNCGEITDSVCDNHDSCSYCCNCGDGADETDMEGLDLSGVPTYVPGSLSTVGPYSFGIELEHNGNGVYRASRTMYEVGLQSWQSKEDGSLTGDGAEVVSPILRGPDGFAQMRTAMLALSAAGGTVNHKCGTHVHIGAEDMEPDDIVRLVRFYDRNASIIDQLHPQSRRGSAYYCGNHSDREIADIEQASKSSDGKRGLGIAMGCKRYRKVNIDALLRHGTIEFRQHAGTLNPTKLEHWIRLLFALCDMARFSDASGTFSDVPSLLASLRPYGLSEPSIAYLVNRSLKLAEVA